MNEPQFANRIRAILNQGTRLDAAMVERLRAARERALAAQKPEPELEPALAWAGAARGRLNGFVGFSVRVALAVALVAASSTALYQWQQTQRVAEIEEIDADLLTDDLPIDALLDRGFETWLKQRSSAR